MCAVLFLSKGIRAYRYVQPSIISPLMTSWRPPLPSPPLPSPPLFYTAPLTPPQVAAALSRLAVTERASIDEVYLDVTKEASRRLTALPFPLAPPPEPASFRGMHVAGAEAGGEQHEARSSSARGEEDDCGSGLVEGEEVGHITSRVAGRPVVVRLDSGPGCDPEDRPSGEGMQRKEEGEDARMAAGPGQGSGSGAASVAAGGGCPSSSTTAQQREREHLLLAAAAAAAEAWWRRPAVFWSAGGLGHVGVGGGSTEGGGGTGGGSGDPNERLLAAGATVVSELRADVLRDLGFTCSAGVAHHKILCKLGSGADKGSGFRVKSYKTLSTGVAHHKIMCKQARVRHMRDCGGGDA